MIELMRPVILATFGVLLRAGYRLDALCDDCRRVAQLEADRLPLDRPYQGVRFRCACGSRCRPIISKPQPEARP